MLISALAGLFGWAQDSEQNKRSASPRGPSSSYHGTLRDRAREMTMTYTIRAGSEIIALGRDGVQEAKTVTKPQMYAHATEFGDCYIFDRTPGGAWKQFLVRRTDVAVTPAVVDVPDGIYTLDLAGNDARVTLRLVTDPWDINKDGSRNFFFGKQIVSFLDESAREPTFVPCMHIDEMGGIHIWKPFRSNDAVKMYATAVTTLANPKPQGEGQVNDDTLGLGHK